jgi:hypothetical protein
MANTRLIQRSFTGGELSPEMYGRIDTTVYQNGASLMRNLIARPQGVAAKRPGFRYVKMTKGQGTFDSARLIPFTYSTDQTLVIEVGATNSHYGVATAVTYNTVSVSTASLVADSLTGQRVWCGGSVALVLSNTTSTITLGSSWSPTQPAVGSVLRVDAGYMRFHTQGQTVYTGTANISDWASQVTRTVIVPTSGTTFSSSGNGFHNGDLVYLTGSAISGGSIQPGASNLYYVIQSAGAGTFQLASVENGSPLSTGTPSGSYTITRAFRLGDVVSYNGNGWSCLSAHTTPITPSAINALMWYNMGAFAPGVNGLGSILEIQSPYAVPDLLDVHFAQSEDVVTLTHRNYYPMELRRYSAFRWALSPVVLGSSTGAPTITGTAVAGKRQQVASNLGSGTGSTIVVTSNGTAGESIIAGDTVYIRGTGNATLDSKWFTVRAIDGGNSQIMSLNDLLTGVQWQGSTGVAFSPPGTIERIAYRPDFTNKYCVTSVDATGTESAQSNIITLLNGMYSNGNTNLVSWTAVSGAVQYNIYRLIAGIYGRIGTVDAPTVSFTDDNITPDAGLTPPIYTTPPPLSTVGNYPSTVSYFEQRRCFGGSYLEAQTFYGTRSGTNNDMAYHLPSQADDRIKFKVLAREVNSIRHIVPLNELLLLTNSAEWRVSSINSDVLTADSVSVRPQSYVGSSNVQPEIVNNSLVFCSARGGHVRELGYNWQSQGFVTSDLSLRAAHLFDHENILDISMSQAPTPVVWFVSTTGALIGLTYIPEEQIASWHQHETSGDFKSCCVVAEGNEDILYTVIERYIDGKLTRCVERLDEQMQPSALGDSFFVDCGSSYVGAPATVISNLDWLNGATVKVLADGKVHRDLVVTGGSITLDYPATTVQVGLGYEARLQTLPVAMQIDGLGQGRTKNVNKAWLRLIRSSGVMIGPDANHLVRSNLYDGTPQTVRNDEVEVVLSPSWTRDGRIYVSQSDPLPITITNLTLEVSVGS